MTEAKIYTVPTVHPKKSFVPSLTHRKLLCIRNALLFGHVSRRFYTDWECCRQYQVTIMRLEERNDVSTLHPG